MEKTKEMTQEREAAILEGAINKWGNRFQIVVAIEELSELQKTLCKYLRGLGRTGNGIIPPRPDEPIGFDISAIKEEIADASIMLNQLELIFGDCTEEYFAKMERLEKLVGNVPHQTLAEEQPDGTCKLKDPPSRYTPAQVEVAKAMRMVLPKMQYILRKSNGRLFAFEELSLSPGSSIELPSNGYPGLPKGGVVSLDDILAEGGGE